MMVVLKPGSQWDGNASILVRSESFGLREHRVEGGERTLIGDIDEKVTVAFGGEA